MNQNCRSNVPQYEVPALKIQFDDHLAQNQIQSSNHSSQAFIIFHGGELFPPKEIAKYINKCCVPLVVHQLHNHTAGRA